MREYAARGLVIIGVANCGIAPVLPGVHDSAAALACWGAAQPGMGEARVRCLVDQQAPVRAHQVSDAIREIVDSGVLEQLIIIFIGHGMTDGVEELWLLSDAANEPNIDVTKSRLHAQFGTVPHVIIVSDACRGQVTDVSLAACRRDACLSVRTQGPLRAKAVDSYCATLLGAPAFTSIHDGQSCFMKAFIPAIVGQTDLPLAGTSSTGYVQPRPLRKYLVARVCALLASLGLDPDAYAPDAMIQSEDDAWISRVELAGGKRAAVDRTLAWEDRRESVEQPQLGRDKQHPVLARHSGDRPSLEWSTSPDDLIMALLDPSIPVPSTKELAILPPYVLSALQSLTRLPEPVTTSPCSVMVDGAEIASVYCADGTIDSQHAQEAGISPAGDQRHASCLIQFRNGCWSFVPVLRGYGTHLMIDGTRLTAIDLSPLPTGRVAAAPPAELARRRMLKGVLQGFLDRGASPIEDASALNGVSRLLQPSGPFDLPLVLLVASVAADLGRFDLVANCANAAHVALGVRVLDLDLLVGPDAALSPLLLPLPLTRAGWVRTRAWPLHTPPAGLTPLPESWWTLLSPSSADAAQALLKEPSWRES